MNYLYDGTFEGFLTCVYHNWYTERAEGIFTEGDYQLDLTRFAQSIETDEGKAARVLDAIKDKISKWDAERVYRVFCTTEPEKEMKLLRYIRLGFKRGPRIRLLHGDPIVKAVEAAEQRIGFETHRLTGLVRFSEVELEGHAILYARIEPDNDVLEFIAPHFADRFKSEPFIIHDLKREKAVFSFNKKHEIVILPQDAVLIEASEAETDYRSLWKMYFEAMATKERINPKCQRNFMPVRYWKHLTELQP